MKKNQYFSFTQTPTAIIWRINLTQKEPEAVNIQENQDEQISNSQQPQQNNEKEEKIEKPVYSRFQQKSGRGHRKITGETVLSFIVDNIKKTIVPPFQTNKVLQRRYRSTRKFTEKLLKYLNKGVQDIADYTEEDPDLIKQWLQKKLQSNTEKEQVLDKVCNWVTFECQKLPKRAVQKIASKYFQSLDEEAMIYKKKKQQWKQFLQQKKLEEEKQIQLEQEQEKIRLQEIEEQKQREIQKIKQMQINKELEKQKQLQEKQDQENKILEENKQSEQNLENNQLQDKIKEEGQQKINDQKMEIEKNTENVLENQNQGQEIKQENTEKKVIKEEEIIENKENSQNQNNENDDKKDENFVQENKQMDNENNNDQIKMEIEGGNRTEIGNQQQQNQNVINNDNISNNNQDTQYLQQQQQQQKINQTQKSTEKEIEIEENKTTKFQVNPTQSSFQMQSQFRSQEEEEYIQELKNVHKNKYPSIVIQNWAPGQKYYKKTAQKIQFDIDGLQAIEINLKLRNNIKIQEKIYWDNQNGKNIDDIYKFSYKFICDYIIDLQLEKDIQEQEIQGLVLKLAKQIQSQQSNVTDILVFRKDLAQFDAIRMQKEINEEFILVKIILRNEQRKIIYEDKFEWDIFSDIMDIEKFAICLVADLDLHNGYVQEVQNQIKKQIQYFIQKQIKQMSNFYPQIQNNTNNYVSRAREKEIMKKNILCTLNESLQIIPDNYDVQGHSNVQFNELVSIVQNNPEILPSKYVKLILKYGNNSAQYPTDAAIQDQHKVKVTMENAKQYYQQCLKYQPLDEKQKEQEQDQQQKIQFNPITDNKYIPQEMKEDFCEPFLRSVLERQFESEYIVDLRQDLPY